VICSDVIEHVSDPDELMRFLLALSKKWLVISTPDGRRSCSRFSPYELGPPQSEHHAREWSFKEFRRYVGQFVDVREHSHSNQIHAIQIIVGCKR
jgi:2-polyprenyl-3-methyl-5-hydroxy-6-metoxy-1,4-benzoquinol methylase